MDEADYKRHWSIESMGRRAVEWLRERGGDGAVTKMGRVLAQGDVSPAHNRVWHYLEQRSVVEYYGGARGRSRLRLKEDQ